MKKIIERTVVSSGAPLETDLWIDKDDMSQKVFIDGGWKTLASGGGSSKVSELKDVAVSSPQDGDTLVYNAATNKWENGASSNVPSVLIVEGSIFERDNGSANFTASSGQPSLQDAIQHIIYGGRLLIHVVSFMDEGSDGPENADEYYIPVVVFTLESQEIRFVYNTEKFLSWE